MTKAHEIMNTVFEFDDYSQLVVDGWWSMCHEVDTLQPGGRLPWQKAAIRAERAAKTRRDA